MRFLLDENLEHEVFHQQSDLQGFITIGRSWV